MYDADHIKQCNEEEIKLINDNPSTIHPAVISHPETGKRCLYVNSLWTKRILGLHQDQSSSLLNMLFDLIKRPEFQLRFKWEHGSVAIWDNFATQHYAVFDYAPHRRVMNRVTVRPQRPVLKTV